MLGNWLARGRIRIVRDGFGFDARNEKTPKTKRKRFIFGVFESSPGRTRTYDPAINSRLLYQLSYQGIWGAYGRAF